MEPLSIRHSKKLIRAGYMGVFSLLFICVLAYNNVDWLRRQSPWVLAIPALLILFPLKSHIMRNFTTLTLDGDKLRYQTGPLGKNTRILRVAMIQDVRIEQSLMQRLLGTGSVRVETSRGEDDLAMANIDDPEQVAEAILAAAAKQSKKGERE